jgi:hypothetical protein
MPSPAPKPPGPTEGTRLGVRDRLEAVRAMPGVAWDAPEPRRDRVRGGLPPDLMDVATGDWSRQSSDWYWGGGGGPSGPTAPPVSTSPPSLGGTVNGNKGGSGKEWKWEGFAGD